MTRVSLDGGVHFECRAGESILDAALRGGFALPYGCSNGRCGLCKCHVVSGSTIPLEAELALNQAELDRGFVLLCRRSAESDVGLAISALARELPPKRLSPARIDSLEKMSSRVMKIVMRTPPSVDFQFIPGQYINVTTRGGAYRSYSLAKGPAEDGKLEIHVSYVPGGLMSEYWFKKAKREDLLQVSGPHGTFFWRGDLERQHIFIATGTGIAPINAVLSEMIALTEGKAVRRPILIWGDRTEDDFYLNVDQFRPYVDFVPVASRASNSWSGAKGYVQHELQSRFETLDDAVVYVCGNPEMIDAVKSLSITRHLPRNHFHYDAFVVSSS